MLLEKSQIEALDQRYRATFVNSLAGFRQAVLVGTKSKDDICNLAIFNSLIHLGANPALFGLINRPDTVQRDTLQNIRETGCYTLNYVPADYFYSAHQTSARYDKNVSEFEAVGFHERYISGCYAPAVEEATVRIVMRLEQIIPIELNGTLLIIGSIDQVEIPDDLVQNDGFVNLNQADVLVTQGLDAYFTTRFLGRLPYAKP
jgi:flavin reductase (DIM6/NTAB) family NADH-FMN oxidoreductase RutF